MARKLSKLEEELKSIGLSHLPEHSHQIILKEWNFYGDTASPYGKLIFSCKKCNKDYSINLTKEEQTKLFHVDTPNLSKGRYYTL